jgi:GT2 family glycosyltransferase
VPRTAAVVLNYRTPLETARAVRSLQAGTSPLDILVVDNASSDASVEVLRETLTDIDVLPAAANRGFSNGCNIGITRALERGADRVLLLNSDAVVLPDTVSALEHALDTTPGLGIVGPVILEYADPERVQSIGITYRQPVGRMRHDGYRLPRARVAGFSVRTVDGVSGCAMLIHREVFERIGLLDERYFFGFEDLDFCVRARQTGFTTACIGAASVLHEGSLSIGRRSPSRVYFAVRNHLLFHSCIARTLAGRLFGAMAVLGWNLGYVLITAEVKRTLAFGALIRGVRDHLSGKYGPE